VYLLKNSLFRKNNLILSINASRKKYQAPTTGNINEANIYIYIYIYKKIHLPQHSNSYQATENEANPPHPGTIQNL